MLFKWMWQFLSFGHLFFLQLKKKYISLFLPWEWKLLFNLESCALIILLMRLALLYNSKSGWVAHLKIQHGLESFSQGGSVRTELLVRAVSGTLKVGELRTEYVCEDKRPSDPTWLNYLVGKQITHMTIETAETDSGCSYATGIAIQTFSPPVHFSYCDSNKWNITKKCQRQFLPSAWKILSD